MPIPDWEKENIALVVPSQWSRYNSKQNQLNSMFVGLGEILVQQGAKPYWIRPNQSPLDIWIRDWGWVEGVYFTYRPEYAKGLYSPSKVEEARYNLRTIRPEAMDFPTLPILLDGGNLVHNGEIAILTEKVLYNNPQFIEREVREYLAILGFQRILTIPDDPADVISHADGVIRFLSKDLVVWNTYEGINEKYEANLVKWLNDVLLAEFDIRAIQIPGFATNTSYDGVPSAEGNYVNFIHMRQCIIFPTFGRKDCDQLAISQMKLAMNQAKISHRPFIPFKSSRLAKFGGVLNCISLTW